MNGSKYYYLEYHEEGWNDNKPFKMAGYGHKEIDSRYLHLKIIHSTSDLYLPGQHQTFFYIRFQVCREHDTLEELMREHMVELL